LSTNARKRRQFELRQNLVSDITRSAARLDWHLSAPIGASPPIDVPHTT